jgi:hypothetical protein
VSIFSPVLVMIIILIARHFMMHVNYQATHKNRSDLPGPVEQHHGPAFF